MVMSGRFNLSSYDIWLSQSAWGDRKTGNLPTQLAQFQCMVTLPAFTMRTPCIFDMVTSRSCGLASRPPLTGDAQTSLPLSSSRSGAVFYFLRFVYNYDLKSLVASKNLTILMVLTNLVILTILITLTTLVTLTTLITLTPLITLTILIILTIPNMLITVITQIFRRS